MLIDTLNRKGKDSYTQPLVFLQKIKTAVRSPEGVGTDFTN